MLSALNFGGKNPATWLQSRAKDMVGYVTDRVATKAGLNEVIHMSVSLFGVGRGYVEVSQAWVVCLFSQDFASYLFASQRSYFSVFFSIQYLFCFA
jgi:hypothetical protein